MIRQGAFAKSCPRGPLPAPLGVPHAYVNPSGGADTRARREETKGHEAHRPGWRWTVALLAAKGGAFLSCNLFHVIREEAAEYLQNRTNST